MRDQVPADFVLPLKCIKGPDGLRRMCPADGWESFLELASAGGLAVIIAWRNLGRTQRNAYRFSRLLFRRAPCTSQCFGQSFQHVRDLYIAPSARTDPDKWDVLPPILVSTSKVAAGPGPWAS
jgi:hypothetical protein